MYRQQADKLIGLLRGSDETIEQAFVLLDSLIETLPEEGKVAFRKVFQGLSFEKGTFAWMTHHLEKMSSWQHRSFFEKGYFWRCMDLYLRIYPESIESFPTVLHLKYIHAIPSFLQAPNPCRVLVLDNTCQSVSGLERCTTLSSVRFNMKQWEWRNFPIELDLNAIRNRTEELAITAPGFSAQWAMHEGHAELIILKETIEYATHLDVLNNQISLSQYPLLQFSTVGSSNLDADLWSQQTPYNVLEFGAFKLLLSPDKDRCIADRVEYMKVNVLRLYEVFDGDTDDVFGRMLEDSIFPNLSQIVFEGDGDWSLPITPQTLQKLPSLMEISVQGGYMTFVKWADDVWDFEHPLSSVTVDEYDTFHHHWEFSDSPGTLRQRLSKMSVSFDWISQHTQLLQGITHLNIFQSDVSWPFVAELSNLQELYVEGGQWEGDFAYHNTIDFPMELFFEPEAKMDGQNTKGVKSLFDLISKTDRHITGVKREVLEQLRRMSGTKNIPGYLESWIRDMGVVRISHACAWMDGEKFKFRAYPTFGPEYKEYAMKASTLNLERLLAGVPDVQLAESIVPCTSLRYNSSRVPLSTFQSMGITHLWIESECALSDLAGFEDIQVLHMTSQSDWLTELPEEVGLLKNLQELYVWNNEFTSLPESMGQLTNLRTINISGNRFTAIPEVLLSLPKLETICLRGCRKFEGLESLESTVPNLKFVDPDVRTVSMT